jgi:hypothetical protein
VLLVDQGSPVSSTRSTRHRRRQGEDESRARLQRRGPETVVPQRGFGDLSVGHLPPSFAPFSASVTGRKKVSSSRTCTPNGQFGDGKRKEDMWRSTAGSWADVIRREGYDGSAAKRVGSPARLRQGRPIRPVFALGFTLGYRAQNSLNSVSSRSQSTPHVRVTTISSQPWSRHKPIPMPPGPSRVKPSKPRWPDRADSAPR